MGLRATACSACAAVLGLAFGGCGSRAEIPAYPRLESTLPEDATFAIVGDLQDTSWMEELIGREDNDRERGMMLGHIAERQPAMILSLGDMVFSGQSAAAWQAFDDVMRPVSRIPIVAVAGNHDWYCRSPGQAINAGFRLRFLPEGAPLTWHEHRVGALAVLVIDSNLEKLKHDARLAQFVWYRDRLRLLEADPTVRGVMVAAHHPRYTNGIGAGVGDWDESRGAIYDAAGEPSAGNGMGFFGELFDASSKAFLMVSGHTHSYERFATLTAGGRKHYVVSGGGGGPRRAVRPGAARHRDRYAHPGEEGALELRPFNVIWASQDSRGLRLQVMGLEKGADQLARMEALQLPWPK